MAWRPRLSLALGIAAVGLLVYLVTGHGLHAPPAMEEAMHGSEFAGLCLVLFTLVTPLALVLPRLRPQADSPPLLSSVLAVVPVEGPPVQARASPVWLQRFLR
jgi:hypothetical protein